MRNLIFLLFFLLHCVGIAQTFIRPPSLIEGLAAVTKAAGTTTLLASSQTQQVFTGTSAETVALPDATTLDVGRKFYIINSGATGDVTVEDDAGGGVGTVPASMGKIFILRGNGTAAGNWDILGNVTVGDITTGFTDGEIPFSESGFFTSDTSLTFNPTTKVLQSGSILANQSGLSQASYAGVQVAPTGTLSSSAYGLYVDMNGVSVTGGYPTSILTTSGTLNISSETDIPSSVPLKTDNNFYTSNNVVSGSPVTGTSMIGMDFQGNFTFDDDFAVGPIGFGYSFFGINQAISGSPGNTVDDYIQLEATPFIAATSTGGTITSLTNFQAGAIVNLGGTSPTITAQYALKIPDGFSSGATTTYGIYSADPLTLNLLAGSTLFKTNIKLEETGAGTDAITLQAPASIAADYTLTLPVDDGASGEVLTTDGSGVLSWGSAGSGTVTSVALSVPAASIFGVTGSPVTTSGTLGLTTTGTQGGIPYFSSTSALSSSSAGTSGDWVLSGGTGAITMSSTTTTAKVIDGSADAIQLTVQGNATQTSDIFVAEKSDGTDLLEVTNVNGTKIRGTTTNDSASSGFVGEYLETISTTTNMPATTVTGDCGTLSLTAGDWDVTGIVYIDRNGATVTAAPEIWITTTVGNSNTGRVPGSNYAAGDSLSPTPALGGWTPTVPNVRVSISSTTTYRLKCVMAYSTGQPIYASRISARRQR